MANIDIYMTLSHTLYELFLQSEDILLESKVVWAGQCK